MDITGAFATIGKDIAKVPELVYDAAKDLVVVESDLPPLVTKLDGLAADITAAIAGDGLNLTADKQVASDLLDVFAQIKAFVNGQTAAAASSAPAAS